jgi:hypothetical protein
MHQTTVRFGPDLWAALEDECARLGVSVAQYLREAAIARLAYTAGRTGQPDYEFALIGAGAHAISEGRPDGGAQLSDRPMPRVSAESAEQVLAAAAVSAQSKLVRARAGEVREQAAQLRRRRRERNP